MVNPISAKGAVFMDHARADSERRPLQPGLAHAIRRRRLLLVGGIAMVSGVLCALVLLNAVSPEQASAVGVITASCTALVRTVIPDQQRDGAAIED
ncbi:hypothetical protein VM636_13780 [Streptomyces sp. SCSIO 75703]|uniref:hypothetical protein n=1 Tax=Streptomyces sp. SCSIO 75703 TaxID=3112165 RepID=UPI0030D3A67C